MVKENVNHKKNPLYYLVKKLTYPSLSSRPLKYSSPLTNEHSVACTHRFVSLASKGVSCDVPLKKYESIFIHIERAEGSSFFCLGFCALIVLLYFFTTAVKPALFSCGSPPPVRSVS